MSGLPRISIRNISIWSNSKRGRRREREVRKHVISKILYYGLSTVVKKNLGPIPLWPWRHLWTTPYFILKFEVSSKRRGEREVRKHVISKILSSKAKWPKSDKNQVETNFWCGVATTFAVVQQLYNNNFNIVKIHINSNIHFNFFSNVWQNEIVIISIEFRFLKR